MLRPGADWISLCQTSRLPQRSVPSKQFPTMRSQKQNNKAPRPFKNKNSGRDWSGGSGSGGFIPGRKVLPQVKKPEVSPTPEIPPSES